VAKSSKKKTARATKSKPKTSASAKSKKSPPKPARKPPSVKVSRAPKKVPVSARKLKTKPAAKVKKPLPVKVKATPVKVVPTKKTPPKKASAKQPEPKAKKPALTTKAPPVSPASKSVVKPGRSAAPALPKTEPFQMQPAVATNLKPRKSQIGLGVRELEHFADMLLAKRRELVGDMSSMEREALRTGGSSNLSTLPVHMADMGTDNYEQEFTLGLVEKDRNLLREINHALAKIQNGTYGICEGTGRPIGKPRLEVQPWARFSIEYARQREKNGMGVRTI